jgi:hypothetical protein
MVPGVPKVELQSVEAALASDASNEPTDMDNAAHVESMSIRRMEASLGFSNPERSG